MTARIELPVDDVVQRYVEAGQSADEIAAVYGVTKTTILGRLHERGVKLRPGHRLKGALIRRWRKGPNGDTRLYQRQWRAANPGQQAVHSKGWRESLKDEMLAVYGPACRCCGEARKVFLTLDHINGNGAEERRRSGNRGGQSQYYLLKAQGWPVGYRVLCWNCNAATHILGICPHQTP